MISFLDRQVGRVMDLLRREGLDDNTIVFFTSDNGTTMLKAQVDYEFFESVGPLRGLKGSLYEGGIRVPMIARWPGKIAAGAVTHHAAAHYDVLATLTDLAGAEAPAGIDSVSFLPTLLSRPADQQPHEYLFWDFSGYGGQLAVRMGHWKGVKQGLHKDPEAPLELYDLKNDIGEQRNVADAHPEVAARIEAIMLEARTRPAVERFRFGRYGPS
jgi:arylsulfatase